MSQENRAERDHQLREPVPGSFPESEIDFSAESSLRADTAAWDNDSTEEEADLNEAAMAVRPFGGPLSASKSESDNSNVINRRAIQNLAAQSEANREEEAIVRRVLAGDTEGFAELIDRYKLAVYNLCARMLHDPTEAEDAAQEVFVRAYTQLHSYQPGRRFSTWILSIASHYCIDLLRRRKPSVDLDTIAFWKQSEQPEPEEQAMTTETRDEVRGLLEKLPDKYRGVTVLRYWQDMSYEEIADATGLSVATVKTRLFRARELLAKELEKQRRSGNQLEQEADNNVRSRGLLKKRAANGNVK